MALTYSCLAVDDQQFLALLIKYGGSEKKNISRFSLVWGLGTLYMTEQGSVVDPGNDSLVKLHQKCPHQLTPLYLVHSFPEQRMDLLTHEVCTSEVGK